MLGIRFRNVAKAIVFDVSTGGLLDTITESRSVYQALFEGLGFGNNNNNKNNNKNNNNKKNNYNENNKCSESICVKSSTRSCSMCLQVVCRTQSLLNHAAKSPAIPVIATYPKVVKGDQPNRRRMLIGPS